MKIKRQLGQKITYEAALRLKAVDKAKSVVTFVFSTDGQDRHGDIIVQNFDLKNFLGNPVFINSHRYGDATEVIGRVNSIRKIVSASGSQHEGEVEFAVDANPKAKVIFDLYAGGFLHAVSIGGIPLEFDAKGNITKLELLEVSAVAVPANAEALAKQKGIDTSVLGKAEDADDVVCCVDCRKEITDDADLVTRDTEDPEIAEIVCKNCDEASKAAAATVTKDVAETVALAQVISNLHYLIRYFNQNEVAAEVTDKMVAALTLLLEALRDEAVIGQKGFDLTEVAAIVKEGRVLSEKNRNLIADTVEKLSSTLDALSALLEATSKSVDGDTCDKCGAAIEACTCEADDENVEKKVDVADVLPADHRKNLALRQINEGIKNLKSIGETQRSKHAGSENPDVRAENTRLINNAIRGLLKHK